MPANVVDSYVVQRSAKFYPEVLQIFVYYVGSALLQGFDRHDKDGISIADPPCLYNLELHDVPAFEHFLRAPTEPVPDASGDARLHFFRAPTGEPPPFLRFSISPTPSTRTSDHPQPAYELPSREMGTRLCTRVLGWAYESRRDEIVAKYGRKPAFWPPDIQFFRLVRNACFHDNHFDIRHQVDLANPPQWRGLVIPSKAAVNGRKLIGEFIFIPDVLPMLCDMSDSLP